MIDNLRLIIEHKLADVHDERLGQEVTHSLRKALEEIHVMLEWAIVWQPRPSQLLHKVHVAVVLNVQFSLLEIIRGKVVSGRRSN